ncbi:MAG: DUF4186 domain-containing protein [Erysipelotrichaceae bacterium]|nr:DUF4186 domain-containing protein [Erysipelotrichaceae bacterium]
MSRSIEETLKRLSSSKFRSSFHLSAKDRKYIEQKGMDVIASHTRDFVRQKVSAACPDNDGRQTPMSGHPSFKAMHATACCCRGCLNRWYRVPKGIPLNEQQQEKITRLILAWIENEMHK